MKADKAFGIGNRTAILLLPSRARVVKWLAISGASSGTELRNGSYSQPHWVASDALVSLVSVSLSEIIG